MKGGSLDACLLTTDGRERSGHWHVCMPKYHLRGKMAMPSEQLIAVVTAKRNVGYSVTGLDSIQNDGATRLVSGLEYTREEILE